VPPPRASDGGKGPIAVPPLLLTFAEERNQLLTRVRTLRPVECVGVRRRTGAVPQCGSASRTWRAMSTIISATCSRRTYRPARRQVHQPPELQMLVVFLDALKNDPTIHPVAHRLLLGQGPRRVRLSREANRSCSGRLSASGTKAGTEARNR
jgi:hypothetical protein